MKTVILEQVSRLLVPLMLLFSFFIFFRGHNSPGGGFAGGLILASAFLLYALVWGAKATRAAFGIDPVRITVIGMAIAGGCALLPALFGEPALKAYWVGWDDIHLGTPLLFDFGVYLTVAGAGLNSILSFLRE